MRAKEFLKALETAPIVTLADITHGQPFLVLAPHPDDETLGVGGLIAAGRQSRQTVDVMILTDGSGSHQSKLYPARRLTELRYQEVTKACAILGLDAKHLHFLGFKDASTPSEGPSFDTAVDRIARFIRERRIMTLFVTWEADPHCDHQAAAKIAKAVRKVLGRLNLLAYPIWGWHLPPEEDIRQPAPKAMRVDISPFMALKQQAIAAHASQVTNLIADAPDGFRLDAAMLTPLKGQFEYLVEVTT